MSWDVDQCVSSEMEFLCNVWNKKAKCRFLVPCRIFQLWIVVNLRQERLNSNDVKDGTLLSDSWKTTRKVCYITLMHLMRSS